VKNMQYGLGSTLPRTRGARRSSPEGITTPKSQSNAVEKKRTERDESPREVGKVPQGGMQCDVGKEVLLRLR